MYCVRLYVIFFYICANTQINFCILYLKNLTSSYNDIPTFENNFPPDNTDGPPKPR